MIFLRPDFRPHFPADDAFDRILRLEGEVFRQLAGRRTLRFEVGGKSYFIKIHLGVGWKEIVKNLVHLRLPVLGASNEWRAIRRFEELGVDTMAIAGYGQRGWNPARLESFIVTEDLAGTVSLEDFCRDWAVDRPDPKLKRALIDKVAGIARTLHQNGVNHRDFYICHFLLDPATAQSVSGNYEPRLHVIDLHRVQLRRRTPERWVVKDVAALCFSSMDIGLTSRDLYRFMMRYTGLPLRKIDMASPFWSKVVKRAVKLYYKEFGKQPQFPFSF